MTFIIISLIAAFIGGIVTVFNDNNLLGELYTVVFDCDTYLTTITGVNFFDVLMPLSYGIGMALIILKFLKKAFEVYVMWTDGDPDTEPVQLLTNFIKAIGTALIFQWLYGLFVDICRELTDSILSHISDNTDFTTELVTALTSIGLVPAISGLIFFICFLILYFSFMMRGVEMMVMEIGVPLACCGLLDNDQGVFRAYINQFVKAFVTTIVQIMLCKIGLALMLNATIISVPNIFCGIACLLTALSMPKILREFLVPTGGDGKVTNTVMSTVRVVSMIRGGKS